MSPCRPPRTRSRRCSPDAGARRRRQRPAVGGDLRRRATPSSRRWRRFAAAGPQDQRLPSATPSTRRSWTPMLDEFREVAEGVTFHPPRVPVVSNRHRRPRRPPRSCARPATGCARSAQAVRFADGVRGARGRRASPATWSWAPTVSSPRWRQDCVAADGAGRFGRRPAAAGPRPSRGPCSRRSPLSTCAACRVDWAAVFAAPAPAASTCPRTLPARAVLARRPPTRPATSPASA